MSKDLSTVADTLVANVTNNLKNVTAAFDGIKSGAEGGLYPASLAASKAFDLPKDALSLWNEARITDPNPDAIETAVRSLHAQVSYETSPAIRQEKSRLLNLVSHASRPDVVENTRPGFPRHSATRDKVADIATADAARATLEAELEAARKAGDNATVDDLSRHIEAINDVPRMNILHQDLNRLQSGANAWRSTIVLKFVAAEIEGACATHGVSIGSTWQKAAAAAASARKKAVAEGVLNTGTIIGKMRDAARDYVRDSSSKKLDARIEAAKPVDEQEKIATAKATLFRAVRKLADLNVLQGDDFLIVHGTLTRYVGADVDGDKARADEAAQTASAALAKAAKDADAAAKRAMAEAAKKAAAPVVQASESAAATAAADKAAKAPRKGKKNPFAEAAGKAEPIASAEGAAPADVLSELDAA